MGCIWIILSFGSLKHYFACLNYLYWWLKQMITPNSFKIVISHTWPVFLLLTFQLNFILLFLEWQYCLFCWFSPLNSNSSNTHTEYALNGWMRDNSPFTGRVRELEIRCFPLAVSLFLYVLHLTLIMNFLSCYRSTSEETFWLCLFWLF